MSTFRNLVDENQQPKQKHTACWFTANTSNTTNEKKKSVTFLPQNLIQPQQKKSNVNNDTLRKSIYQISGQHTGQNLDRRVDQQTNQQVSKQTVHHNHFFVKPSTKQTKPNISVEEWLLSYIDNISDPCDTFYHIANLIPQDNNTKFGTFYSEKTGQSNDIDVKLLRNKFGNRMIDEITRANIYEDNKDTEDNGNYNNYEDEKCELDAYDDCLCDYDEADDVSDFDKVCYDFDDKQTRQTELDELRELTECIEDYGEKHGKIFVPPGLIISHASYLFKLIVYASKQNSEQIVIPDISNINNKQTITRTFVTPENKYAFYCWCLKNSYTRVKQCKEYLTLKCNAPPIITKEMIGRIQLEKELKLAKLIKKRKTDAENKLPFKLLSYDDTIKLKYQVEQAFREYDKFVELVWTQIIGPYVSRDNVDKVILEKIHQIYGWKDVNKFFLSLPVRAEMVTLHKRLCLTLAKHKLEYNKQKQKTKEDIQIKRIDTSKLVGLYQTDLSCVTPEPQMNENIDNLITTETFKIMNDEFDVKEFGDIIDVPDNSGSDIDVPDVYYPEYVDFNDSD